jgi:hypothetical protein
VSTAERRERRWWPFFNTPFFDILDAVEKPMGQPDGLTDDVRWKTTTGRVGIRHTRTSNPGQRDNIMQREEID